MALAPGPYAALALAGVLLWLAAATSILVGVDMARNIRRTRLAAEFRAGP